ncbi:hypothetical protein [Nibricoccus sp. IMCC34717]|uniref:hypothetical protein n=1 Tax=Nibricoccus sp. IMCC34717 TaxID=3034021 RepID=UPI00384F20AE
MDAHTQTLLALAAVALAVLGLAWRAWRRSRAVSSGCAGSCCEVGKLKGRG